MSGRTGKVVASYSIGAASGIESVGGLVGTNLGVVLDSLWDSVTSMQVTAGGKGKIDSAQSATNADLQSPATSDGRFARWSDGLWDFGGDDQYPALTADMGGDGNATWQEFGRQSRVVPEPSPQVDLGDIKPGFFPPQGPSNYVISPNPPIVGSWEHQALRLLQHSQRGLFLLVGRVSHDTVQLYRNRGVGPARSSVVSSRW